MYVLLDNLTLSYIYNLNSCLDLNVVSKTFQLYTYTQCKKTFLVSYMFIRKIFSYHFNLT